MISASPRPVAAVVVPDTFALSEQDKNNPLWGALMAYFENRLQALRTKNDGALSEADTANIRGRIAEIKAMMNLENQPEAIR